MPPVSKHAIPKLRASCNDCGVTKVKCDRAQPDCGRCVALGITCTYGLSRKAGKPPRRRLPAQIQTRHHDTIHGGSHVSGASTQNHLWGLGAEMPLLPSGDSAMDTNQMSDTGLSCVNPLVLDYPPSSFGCFTNGSIIASHPTNLSENQDASSGFERITTTRKDTDTHNSHSCPRESYEIFRDLICPGPYLHAPESDSNTVSADLDFVLLFTKTAVTRLSQLLKCSCAQSGHRVMVHASIISRLLIWYEQAADLKDHHEKDGTSPSDIASTPGPGGSKSSSLARSTGFIVSHIPVSMGVFGIENQTLQATLKIQLILNELKDTAHLIDLFASAESIGCSSGLNSYLGAWLRGEHSRIVQLLRTKLHVMNENLES